MNMARKVGILFVHIGVGIILKDQSNKNIVIALLINLKMLYNEKINQKDIIGGISFYIL